MVTGASKGSCFFFIVSVQGSSRGSARKKDMQNKKGELTEILKSPGTSALPHKGLGLQSLDQTGEGEGVGLHTGCSGNRC